MLELKDNRSEGMKGFGGIMDQYNEREVDESKQASADSLVEEAKTEAAKEEVQMQAALEEAQRERDQFRNLLQRSQAELMNYRKRVEEERLEWQRNANASLLLKLLPSLDDLERAVAQAPQDMVDDQWLEGIKLIHRNFLAVLQAVGVTRIEALGRDFDPWDHEALSYEETSGYPEGRVISVVREGYRLHDRVLRPSQVRVAKAPTDPSAEGPEPFRAVLEELSTKEE